MSLNTFQEIVDIAMSIIVDAGDARLKISQGFEAIADREFELCEKSLEEARRLLAQAHGKQTDIMQNECAGDGEMQQHPIVFIHAQDTLMTVYSELNICKQMLNICKKNEVRIASMEKRLHKDT